MEAIRRAERQLELNPHNARALSLGAGSLRAVGQSRRALEWVREAERLCPDDMAVIINSALTHLHLGLKDEALDRLERMFNKGWGKKDWVENDPDYDPLREEPRFKAMMQKLR
jgi:tetratricopeptide (TPR) repeat protein